MVSFAPCKINLGLHIVRKREDGFHEIDTCFYPVPWYDVVEVVAAEKFSFHQTGIAVPGLADENLCVRAYQMLRDEYDLPPVQVHLHKIIPIGAGLGGGSSDAAHTLRMLNTLFHLEIPPPALAAFAARLGSDCAFFIQDLPARGTGRGEVLEPVSLSLKGKWLCIVKPQQYISTAEAYALVSPRTPARNIMELVTTYTPAQWPSVLDNDFEGPLFNRYPALAEIKGKLYAAGAQYASLSGSGSALYGIFDQPSGYLNFDGMSTWTGVLD